MSERGSGRRAHERFPLSMFGIQNRHFCSHFRSKFCVMRYVFEHLGVAVFAVTGVLAAKNKLVDLFGVVVLALVTALGGGTLRDLLLGTRPFWMTDVSFAFSAIAVAAVTFFA